MARRAIWRASSDDPRSPGGWLLRDLDYWEFRLFRGMSQALFLVAIYLLIERQYFSAIVLMVSVAAFPKLRLRPTSIATLLTLPPPARPFPLTVEILDDSVLLGRDRGIATFVDGWLQFEGHRTWFGLRNLDVKSLQKDGSGVWTFKLDEGGTLRLWPDERLEVEGLRESDLRPRFARQIAAWRADAVPDGEGAVLPPNTAHASGWARAIGDLILLTLGLMATVLVIKTFGMAWGIAALWLFVFPSLGKAVAGIGRLRSSRLPTRPARTLP